MIGTQPFQNDKHGRCQGKLDNEDTNLIVTSSNNWRLLFSAKLKFTVSSVPSLDVDEPVFVFLKS
jgi:hypothetical protein